MRLQFSCISHFKHTVRSIRRAGSGQRVCRRGCLGKCKKEQMYSECSLEYSLNILQFVAPALPMLVAVSLKLIASDGFFSSAYLLHGVITIR